MSEDVGLVEKLKTLVKSLEIATVEESVAAGVKPDFRYLQPIRDAISILTPYTVDEANQ